MHITDYIKTIILSLVIFFVLEGCGTRIKVGDHYSGFITDIRVQDKGRFSIGRNWLEYVIEDNITGDSKMIRMKSKQQEFQVGDFVSVTVNGSNVKMRHGNRQKVFDKLATQKSHEKRQRRQHDMQKADYIGRLSNTENTTAPAA